MTPSDHVVDIDRASHLGRRHVADRVHGVVQHAEHPAIEAHLAKCAACRAAIADEAALQRRVVEGVHAAIEAVVLPDVSSPMIALRRKRRLARARRHGHRALAWGAAVAAVWVLMLAFGNAEPVRPGTRPAAMPSDALPISDSVGAVLLDEAFDAGCTGGGERSLPGDWEGDDAGAFSIDCAGGVSGTGGMVADVDATSPVIASAGSALAVAAGKAAGRRVRLSASVRTELTSGWAGMWMNAAPGSGGDVAHGAMDDRRLSGFADWQRVDIVLDMPEERPHVSFGAFVAGHGRAWFDDVRLETVGDDVPLTGGSLLATPRNLDFETSSTGAELPYGWQRFGTTPQSYAASLDHTVVHGGKTSGHLAAISGQPPGSATIAQTVLAGAYRGRRLRLTAWLRSEGITVRGSLWMRVEDSRGQVGPMDDGSDRPLEQAAGWQQHTIVLDVADDATFIHYGIGMSGPGQMWVDDVRLEVVGSAGNGDAMP